MQVSHDSKAFASKGILIFVTRDKITSNYVIKFLRRRNVKNRVRVFINQMRLINMRMKAKATVY